MKIMIVDDQRENICFLEALLRGKGYETAVAYNGREALDKLRSDEFWMIISDILMPVMDGFQLCMECKRDDSLKAIPFIFYTATYTEKKDEQLALSLGADRFVLKPTEPEEFIKIIENLLSEKEKGVIEAGYIDAPVVEAEVYKQYSERLVRKLENKMLELKENEERFQTLLASLKDVVVWAASADGKDFYYVNSAVESVYGRPAKDFLDNPRMWIDTVHPDDRERARISEEEMFEKGGKDIEYRIVRPDGEIRWLHDRASVVSDDYGNPLRIGGVATDITERKRAEESLRESARILKETQELAHLGNWYWDVKTGDVTWSEEVYKIFRLDPEKFKPDINAIMKRSPWPGDATRDEELIRRVMENHEKGTYEQRFLRPDGSTGYYFSSFQGIYDADGELKAIFGTVQDITESKTAENELRMSEERYRSFFSASMDAVFLTAPDGRIIAVNQSACKMFGRTEEELLRIGRTGVTDASDPRLKNALEERENTGRFHGELTFVRSDGSKFPGEISSVVFSNRDGDVYTSMVIRDITERKKNEEEKAILVKAIETTKDAIHICTPAATIVYANKSMSEL
ncbi:MAG TPA: PAS domain S-box protein, partial [bacterium]|nr:PAS domain S-box protein [bacterium]